MSKLTKQDSTSEFACKHFDWDTRITPVTAELVDTMRNQLHQFHYESQARDVTRNMPAPELEALPVPEAKDAIEKAITHMSIGELKAVLKDLESETIRLTAVRAMVIATKKEIKKVVNT